jgi:hypothetical protein
MCKPHKHAAVIIAWASGHAVEERVMRNGEWGSWQKVVSHSPTWWLDSSYDFRIKPKEDTVVYAHVHRRGTHSAEVYITCEHNWNVEGKPCFTDPCNVKFTFDGETNELKHSEVIKP